MLFGGVEMGGTTTVCAVATGPGDLRDRVRIETTAPEPTLARVVAHLERHRGELSAIGVASFGPLDLDRGSAGYGSIMRTPKLGWDGVDLTGTLRRALGVPVGIDTDVNGAALAEARWGAAQGLDTFVYVTVGTGIGGGGLAGGRVMHGLTHPEMGHMRIPRHPRDPLRRGACPFHRDCWEGWAAKAALERRWGDGVQATDLGSAERELVAQYLAAGVVNIVCTLSPQRVILGGGIVLGGGDAAHRDRLLALIRERTAALLNGYPPLPAAAAQMDGLVVAPALGPDAGVLGAIELARREAERAG